MLLMMGGTTPKTCWATNKHRVKNSENCCILLVDFIINYTKMHGPTNLKCLHFTDRFLPNTALRFISRSSLNCLDYRGFQSGSALLLPQRIKIVVIHNMQMWMNIHVQRCRNRFLSYPVTIRRIQCRTAEVICSKVIYLKRRSVRENILWHDGLYLCSQYDISWARRFGQQ